ncbi:hypothetical protein [Anaeromyxobacter paludicola]|uniref:Zinc-regulated TonB-dependent outer membrane receptor n=1 Tax=Anaeromyxobacter paludicola TaxID=2918171 RepID=A0ABN6N5C4_9BACT|nr:hypothetical protein [Anaeromyxobacter paludicola]BDG07278.1 hypothetical protein AMPC_03910 [Anaeromyxobacter paludicola]
MRSLTLAALAAVALVVDGRAVAQDAAPAGAQPAEPSQQAPQSPQSPEERQRLEEQIAKELGASPGATPTPPAPPDLSAPPPSPSTAQGQQGGNPFARLLLLPDISAIGDFAAAYDSRDAAVESPRSGPVSQPHQLRPLFQELELGIQSVVDPYARADAFISFTPDGVSVEEAYLTTLQLPAGLQARAGKLFSPFGRLNQQHPHVWDFVDAPLALDRLVSADQLKGPGLDVAWLAPVPWFLEAHLYGQTTTPAFEDKERRTVGGRVLQYFDLTDAVVAGLGLSAARLEEPASGAWRDLGGVDVHVKIRPPQGRSYLALQGELFWRRLTDPVAPAQADVGGYAQAVWRDGPYFAYGARYDFAPAFQDSRGGIVQVDGTEHRASAVAAWLPSEFQRLRLQAGWDFLPGGREGLELLLQLEFAIGAHGAHPF